MCDIIFYSFDRELSHSGKNIKGLVFSEALAQREESNRSGKMTVSVLHLQYRVHVLSVLSVTHCAYM